MKYLDEFRSASGARDLAKAIGLAARSDQHYRLMEFCGGHTHAICRYGLQALVPANVEFIHGPGCPVCILPGARIESLMQLLEQRDCIVCTYGDVLRVPTSKGRSLIKMRAMGADVRLLYSPLDSIEIARQNPQRDVIFLAVGFETTAPMTAALIKLAANLQLQNLSVYSNHVLTPAALTALLEPPSATPLAFNGLLGPSHVSSVTGVVMYRPFAQRFAMPIVVAGFEPLDILQSTLMLIRQINERRSDVENEYSRAVTETGNRVAQDLIADVFCVRPLFEWRGLGYLPDSGLAIGERYRHWDTEQRFQLPAATIPDIKSCECPAVLRGVLKPQQCKLFGKVCTPETPMGACMVSSEGACAAQWQYQRRYVKAVAVE